MVGIVPAGKLGVTNYMRVSDFSILIILPDITGARDAKSYPTVLERSAPE